MADKILESSYLRTNNIFCSKDVRLPVQLQRAMAAEAEAAREARAKVRDGRIGQTYSLGPHPVSQYLYYNVAIVLNLAIKSVPEIVTYLQ